MTRNFSRIARAAVLLALLAGTAATARAASAGDELARVLERHRRHVMLARPDLATRFGWRGAERSLALITQATLDRDGALLASLDTDAAHVRREALSAADAVRLDSLRARIAAERTPLQSGAWRSDPALYLAPGPQAVLDVAGAPRVAPCERAARAARRLQGLPEFLRAAEINLRDATSGDHALAAAQWSAALDSLRDSLAPRFSACHDPGRQADFVEADTTAIVAMRRFVRFLSAEWPAPRGARP